MVWVCIVSERQGLSMKMAPAVPFQNGINVLLLSCLACWLQIACARTTSSAVPSQFGVRLSTPPLGTRNNFGIRENVGHRIRRLQIPSLLDLRGGDMPSDDSNKSSILHCSGDSQEPSSDEERYSRQVYTLGARAHALVRSTTVVLDGPVESGLLYECGKNLALSGVGGLVILVDDNTESRDVHSAYHHDPLDDLGRAYQRAAREETGMDPAKEGKEEMAAEFFRRLNPSLRVTVMNRSDFLALCYGESTSEVAQNGEICLGSNPVFISIDRPQSTQLVLNDACRRHIGKIIPFVSVETAGVFSRTFCDFGPSFSVIDEDGETPKETLLDRIQLAISEDDRKGASEDDEVFIVHCLEDEKHEVSKGDQITWQKGSDFGGGEDEEVDDNDGNGMGRCEVLRVKNPTCFTVRRISENQSSKKHQSAEEYIQRINHDAVSFSRVKIPREVEFLSLWKALEGQTDVDKDLFAASDLEKSFDMTRRSAIMASFSALDSFAHEYKRLPAALVGDDISIFTKMAVQASRGDKHTDKSFPAIVKGFCRCSKAKLAPIQALCGALGAQEALKAASGLYNPIRQFLLYDCDELLEKAKHIGEEDVSGWGGAAGQVYALGKSLTKKLASQRLFVVGSGAIGCEILKNLSAMGAGTRKKKGGKIVVTDMDTIEKSNLSRQLLFRDVDVGKFKSSAAQEAIQRFNQKVNVEAHTSKVGDDVEGGSFDDSFWSDGVDVILNALDNVDARLYMDSQCVAHRKGLVDAGTLGAKGNVQVVVPGQSESYGSSVDPPEPAIPVCTLKNFPYEISHTIQWGRDLFDGLFNKRPGQINDNIEALSAGSITDFAKRLVHNLGEDAALDVAKEMSEDHMLSSADREAIKSSAIIWAVQLASKLFEESVQDLLRQHPTDSVDEDGDPFWTGTRRPPKALSFHKDGRKGLLSSEENIVNDSLIEFVRTAARLRAKMYLRTDEVISDRFVSVEEAEDALITSAATCSKVDRNENEISTIQQVAELLSDNKNWSEQIHPLLPEEFEKDDDSNGHVAFVTAASNLRAMCYGIKPVDAMETRRVAGRIVPAMITTTAFVSALSCIELLKLLQKAPLNIHRNAFVNLALPFFAFTSPMPAEEIEGYRGDTYTIWDRLIVKEGKKSGRNSGMSLKRFIKEVKRLLPSEDGDDVDVSSVSYGSFMLYANFLHEDDQEILGQTMVELVKDAIVSGDDIDDDFSSEDEDLAESGAALTTEQEAELEQVLKRSFFDFSVIVEDPETGEEIELPPVRLVRWKQEADGEKQ